MSRYLATDFSNKIVLTQRNLSLFQQGEMSRFGIIVTMEIDSVQIASVHKTRLTMYESLSLGTQKCLLSILSRVILEEMCDLSMWTDKIVHNIRVSVEQGSTVKGCKDFRVTTTFGKADGQNRKRLKLKWCSHVKIENSANS